MKRHYTGIRNHKQGYPFCFTLLILGSLLMANCTPRLSGHQAQYPNPAYTINPRIPIQVDQYYSPRIARLESGNWLVYELHLSNFYPVQVKIEGVEVLTDTLARVTLYQNTGDSFARSFKNLSGVTDTTRTTLQPGQRGLIFFWVKLEGSKAPGQLYHRILIQLQGRKLALATAGMKVSKTANVALAPPVKGRWLVAQGADPGVDSTEGHNRLLYPSHGRIRVPQRFASDWVMLGPGNKVAEGDLAKNESYYGFGAEVYAVADGTIVAVQNDVQENIPPEMTEPRTAKNITGNYIVMKIGSGRSVYYGHLQTGSVLVRPGDRVMAGQVIARVGNTGNSTGPHLHFQVQDGDHFSDEGYPYTFREFEKLGTASKKEIDDMADRGKPFSGTLQPRQLKKLQPSYGDIIEFR